MEGDIIMPAVIQGLLNNANITIKQVSEKSKVPFSTLNNAAKKPIESWSIRVLNAFAKGLNKSPSNLLEILQPNNYQLEIDNKNQTIQGVYIADKDNFYNIRTVVEAEHLEGWNPTEIDIKNLLNTILNPDPDLLKEYHEVFDS